MTKCVARLSWTFALVITAWKSRGVAKLLATEDCSRCFSAFCTDSVQPRNPGCHRFLKHIETLCALIRYINPYIFCINTFFFFTRLKEFFCESNWKIYSLIACVLKKTHKSIILGPTLRIFQMSCTLYKLWHSDVTRPQTLRLNYRWAFAGTSGTGLSAQARCSFFQGLCNTAGCLESSARHRQDFRSKFLHIHLEKLRSESFSVRVWADQSVSFGEKEAVEKKKTKQNWKLLLVWKLWFGCSVKAVGGQFGQKWATFSH